MTEYKGPNRQIVEELYRTLELLGADNGLLGTVGSWGTSLPEEDVLANLRGWNDATTQEFTARTEHHETSSPRPTYSRDELRKTG